MPQFSGRNIFRQNFMVYFNKRCYFCIRFEKQYYKLYNYGNCSKKEELFGYNEFHP